MNPGVRNSAERRLLPVLLALLLAVGCGGTETAAGTLNPGDELRLRVIRVFDGDTFLARTADGAELRVRLSEIDAPEKGDPWSNRARDRLRQLIDQREVSIRLFDIDSYRRLVARVYVGDTDVNAQLVREGLAAVYRRYARDPALYELEEAARREQRGFWRSKYRPRGFGSDAPAGSGSHSAARPPGCGRKRYCREMESCKEALFYLRECGLRTIDGDGDGIPCEQLCAGR
ncbi:MAG: nuclease [Gammaproteobacteria bacterium]|nr:MAG: nuclease [Gammaproteobacteria bacterium]